jgi:threonine aldolase
MRQAGILAAAGLIALEKMPKRLHEDHANAKFLAEGLVGLPGIEIDPTRAQTNIVIFDVSGTGMSASEFTHKLAEKNLLAGTADPQRVRFVTHMDVNREACERAIAAVKAVVDR